MGQRDSGESRAGRPEGPDAASGDLVRIRPVARHTDARGAVFEPLAGSALAAQRNVHVVTTEPGSVRGNHVHHRSTEVLVVEGPARVRYRDREGLRDVDVAQDEVVSFTIPPGVPHAVVATGETPQLLVAFRDREHDPDDPDTQPADLL